MTELSERDLAIVAFEKRWWKHAGAKEEAIRVTFGLSAARYYQLVNALIDVPAALVAEPQLVYRLREARRARTVARASRAFGQEAKAEVLLR